VTSNKKIRIVKKKVSKDVGEGEGKGKGKREGEGEGEGEKEGERGCVYTYDEIVERLAGCILSKESTIGLSDCLNWYKRIVYLGYKDDKAAVGAGAGAGAGAAGDVDDDAVITRGFDALFYIYYMFFAIHNPLLEGYIQDVVIGVKNREPGYNVHDAVFCEGAKVIKTLHVRVSYTSSLMYQLYQYAVVQNGCATVVYQGKKGDRMVKRAISAACGSDCVEEGGIYKTFLKSVDNMRLKNAAVILLQRFSTNAGNVHDQAMRRKVANVYRIFTSYLIQRKCVVDESIVLKTNDMDKMCNGFNDICYSNRAVLLLATVCHVFIKEEHMNLACVVTAGAAGAADDVLTLDEMKLCCAMVEEKGVFVEGEVVPIMGCNDDRFAFDNVYIEMLFR
jgi:hypothetical protein